MSNGKKCQNTKETSNEELPKHDFVLNGTGVYHFYSEGESKGSFSVGNAIAVNVDECENIPAEFFDEMNS